MPVKTDDLEQYSRRSCPRIAGIAERDDEDVTQLVLNLANRVCVCGGGGGQRLINVILTGPIVLVRKEMQLRQVKPPADLAAEHQFLDYSIRFIVMVHICSY